MKGTQLLNYNALAIFNPTNKYNNCLWHSTYWCTMTMKVLRNTCNLCIRDLPDMNALIPWACRLQEYILGKSLMPMQSAL